DMLHFSLAFLGVCACLCLQSVLIFGRDIEDLGNFARALHFAFRMVFDEFDDSHFQRLEKVSRPAAYIWFTCYEVLVVIILLNMLLAIIMDNYMMVKKRARLRASVLHQLQELWRRWRMNRRKERVHLKEIWNAFAEEAVWNRKVMCSSDRLLSIHLLVELIPGLPPSQAERTLQNSWHQHLKEVEAPFAVSEAHESLADLESSTRRIRSALYFAFDVVQYFDSRPVPGTDDLVTDTQEKAIFKLAMNEAIEEEDELAAFLERAKREEKDSEKTVVAFVEDQTARLSAEAA
ncbi:pkd2, partial [Symbiodinium pilosum]